MTKHHAFAKLSLIVATLSFGATTGLAKNFEFQRAGKTIKSLSRADMAKLSPEAETTVVEPHLKKDIAYIASDFRKLLDKVYGPKWVKATSLIMTCSDGFKPVVDVQLLVKGQPSLAFAATTGKFEITKGTKLINLAPAYLVWGAKTADGKDSPYIGVNNWPYQVVTFNLVP